MVLWIRRENGGIRVRVLIIDRQVVGKKEDFGGAFVQHWVYTYGVVDKF